MWDQFLQLRKEMDENGRFLNPYLQKLLNMQKLSNAS